MKMWCLPSGILLHSGRAAQPATVSTVPEGRKTETHVFAMQLWLIDYFYLIAGILFLLAGAFYCMHEVSPWLLPGKSSFCQLCFTRSVIAHSAQLLGTRICNLQRRNPQQLFHPL